MITVIDVFAEAGLLARDQGVLPDALVELAIRLDLAGAGDLLTEAMNTCWGHGPVCPLCGTDLRKPADPHPKPPPPPPPPPPTDGPA